MKKHYFLPPVGDLLYLFLKRAFKEQDRYMIYCQRPVQIKVVLMGLFIFLAAFSQAQKNYKRVFPYGAYQKDWALVKTYSGTYGFINRDQQAVVIPIYSKIERFGKYHPNLALVKNISDQYGFIDRSGKEVIPAIFDLKTIDHSFNQILNKYVKNKI